jgi:hypothetical protein
VTGAPSYVDPGAARRGITAKPDALTNGAPGIALGTAASKWGLVGGGAAAPLPSVLIQALSGGPLTEAEADALIELLTGVKAPSNELPDGVSADTARRLLATAPDPELQSLQSELQTLLPAAGADSPQLVDGEVLRAWFQLLDVSHDAAVSFLEWRDRTGLMLDLFRRIDASGEGLVSFEEFSRAIILSSARVGIRSVDPKLLDWALGIDETAASAQVGSAAEIEGLDDQELVRRARAELELEKASM